MITQFCSVYHLTPPTELSELSIKPSSIVKKSNDATTTDGATDDDDGAAGEDVNEEIQRILKKAQIEDRKKHESGSKSGSVTATTRLMNELKAIHLSEGHKKGEYSVELIEDNIFQWDVKIRKVDPDSGLANDLQTLKEKDGQDFVHLNIRFKDNYPFVPPIVAIVSPRMTGGHIYGGGAICMELLTNMGWSSAYNVEAIITQVVSTLCRANARVQFDLLTPYDIRNVEYFYMQLSDLHKKRGWFTPPKNEG